VPVKPPPLPPNSLRFMGEDDERLVRTGSDLARELYAAGLSADQRLLDVGCGYGRLAIGLRHTGFAGTYVGFDILGRHVKWCRRNLANENYQFRHLDVRNDRYNPDGTIEPAEATFPAATARFDGCALFSVFTHMYPDNVARYLAEIHRVLRPGGWAATTWLLFDEERVEAVTSSRAAYPLVHELAPACRYESEDDPLKAIGYHEQAMRELVAAAGLRVRTVRRGSWAGDVPGPGFQDLVIIDKPSVTRPWWARVVSRLSATRRA
jgi:SAM-dependent methyltransferase